MKRTIGLLVLAMTGLSGCASMHTKMDAMSLESYRHGCEIRALQEGLDREIANQLCHCHIQRAIARSSRETFVEATQKLSSSTREERQSGALDRELTLMRTSFKECRAELGIAP